MLNPNARLQMEFEAQIHGVRVEMDWKAYFIEFDRVHGGHPVLFEGRFLWRDGWMYSTHDHAGPEWRPPTEVSRLIFLKRHYWTVKKNHLTSDAKDLGLTIQSLTDMQQARELPLKQKIRYVNEDGKKITEAVDLDLPDLETRLQKIQEEIQECDQALARLVSQTDNKEPTDNGQR